jgi:alkaline phosphatase D
MNDRRQFIGMAAALGASAAWARAGGGQSRVAVQERRDLYPEGVASGDPNAHSVLLWTRRPFFSESTARLRVEVARDEAFGQVVATASVNLSAASDWTVRVLAGNLQPAHVYWYRFIDEHGNASRVGRTVTAPLESDARPAKFAVVSCQNVNLGAQNAYRRMLFEDKRTAEADRLSFVVHLGDFIYETVWYPEDSPPEMYGRRVRDVVHYPHGEKIGHFHIPTGIEDYRAIYRAYLHDPDLQDARARWPFVCMWDNHEFSRAGWQSLQVFEGKTRPAQMRKVAANQAWFEYQPARIRKSGGASLERFDPPRVTDTPIRQFDEHGLGQEANNLAALASLTGYRALRWGRHIEAIITDQRSYRSEEPTGRAEADLLTSREFPRLFPQEALEILDAGRAYAGARAPQNIRFGNAEIANFRQDQPPQTILGAGQKAWFLKTLKASKATWKIWCNTLGTLDYRVDPQNLPPGFTATWPGAGYAGFRVGDASTAYMERAEIYDTVRRESITGFVTVCGDRHSFWAGLAAPRLPPDSFEPVGVVFVVASISAPSAADLLVDGLSQDHPLRSLYFAQQPTAAQPQAVVNLLLRHGVRAALDYLQTGDAVGARRLSNPDLAPHLQFLDFEGHGYATVRATSEALECEFVCIPRPLERSDGPDGGPLRYRVLHRARLWPKEGRPRLEQQVIEGNPGLSLETQKDESRSA